MQQLQTLRLEKAFEWLNEQFSTTDEFQTQNLGVLLLKMNMLCNALPFVNNQMAIAKKLLNEKKVKSYHRLKISSEAHKQYFSASLAKDYVAALCADEQYAYDIAERC